MNRVNHWIVGQWRKPTFVGSVVLLPASWLFRCVVAIRRAVYRWGWKQTARLPVPVIVVGNLSVGGSGKTPLTLHLIEHLRAGGWHPGVVSRGYGGSDSAPRRIEADPDPVSCGDEPALIAQRARCPVAIGADRAAAARLLVDDCDVILADDGLQHYALGRDIEIAVIDGNNAAGNDRLLPAGPLREPPGRLREVDFVAVRDGTRTGCYRFRVIAGAPRPLEEQGEPCPLAHWRGRRAHAVAGIGVPERFFGQLADAGIDIERRPFADHHRFRAIDLAFGDTAPVLMTEKDAVKCRPFADARMWFLPATVDDPDGLAEAVVARLRNRRSGRQDGPAVA